MTDQTYITTADVYGFIVRHRIPSHPEMMPTTLPIAIREPVYGYDEPGRLWLYIPLAVTTPEKNVIETFYEIVQRQPGSDDSYCGVGAAHLGELPFTSVSNLSFLEDLFLTGSFIVDGYTYRLPKSKVASGRWASLWKRFLYR